MLIMTKNVVSLLCYHAQEVIIFILTLKRSDFKRRSIIILWTLKQRQNLMSQQLLIGLIIKPILFLCYTTRLTTSSQCRNYVDRSILTDFHVILTYFVDVISTGEWSTPFWRTFPISFRWMENRRNFNVLLLMCFWKTRSHGRFSTSYW